MGTHMPTLTLIRTHIHIIRIGIKLDKTLFTIARKHWAIVFFIFLRHKIVKIYFRIESKCNILYIIGITHLSVFFHNVT